MSSQVLSLYKVENLLKMRPFDESKIINPISSFYLVNNINEKYVKPNFTEIIGSIKDGKTPKVILISAAGATGKSELTKHLSSSFKIPVFDLSKHNPVASNSLTGLLFEALGHNGLGEFVEQLKSGSSGLIIDALDEGHLKTTIEGYNSFLDGIANICSNASNTPFILLGRTQVIEHTWLYLEEKGIDSSLLRIDPFTISQAVEFIDKQIGQTSFDKQYKEVRNYIIESLQGFFKNPGAVNNKEFQSFIGYAPVLQSITTLLKKTPNFKLLHEDLLKKDDKGIDLIISIVEYILVREKEKIKPLLSTLLKGRPEPFSDFVHQSAYSIEEQCTRILFRRTLSQLSFDFTEDNAFNAMYEEKISEWLAEHPFIQEDNIQNAVFECYIIAKLMESYKYDENLYTYLKTKYKDAFMLFFIFDKLSKDRLINSKFLPFLLSSIKSLDINQEYSSMLVEYEGDENDTFEIIDCIVEFSTSIHDNISFDFKMSIPQNQHLVLGNYLSNININAPIKVVLNGKRCELMPSINIVCSEIAVNTSEFVIEKNRQNPEGIHFECDNFLVDYSGGQVPEVINHLDGDQKFSIFTDRRPDFPFADYYEDSSTLSKLDPLLMEKYRRLRKIVMLFRSHSKGIMAKYKDKIEHKRVLNNEIGENVLATLIKDKILTYDNTFYYWNPSQANNQLGITYIDLRRKIINQKTIDFLNKI